MMDHSLIECDGTGECVTTPNGIWQIQGDAFTLIEEMTDPSVVEE